MKKISILTFSKGDSYGAVLQSYALYKVLVSMGYDVEFISYTWSTIKYRIFSTITPLRRRFNTFRKQYIPQHTKPCHTKEDLIQAVKDSDLCIVGSDQVWNLDITGNRFLHYFFDFVPNNIPRVSYAASFGQKHWIWHDKTEEIKQLLCKFNFISVREVSGVNILKETFQRDSVHVLDPTLVLGNFNPLLEKPKNKDRIVGFMFHPSKSYYDCLKYLKNAMSSDVLIMDRPTKKTLYSFFQYKVSPCTSVNEWITNIAYSKYIITDSFHCMVFSIIFQRQFVFIATNTQLEDRAKSLLDSLGIGYRFFANIIDFQYKYDSITPINYVNVTKSLSSLRETSIHFLETALNLMK